MRHREEVGETLIEIVLTVIIIGLAVAALLAGLGTAAGASKQHRDLATADTVMRSYAEATKDAVRSCKTGHLTWSVSYSAPGFTLSGAPSSPVACPSPTAAQPVPLTVTDGEGHTTRMTIYVRMP